MKRVLCLLLAGLCVAGALTAAAAVKPAYVGVYGNPEEPALRPYKWMLRGFKAFWYQTGTQFRDGNLHTPVIGSTHALRGVRQGTFEMLESTFKGAVFAPVPPKGDFRKLRTLNSRANESEGLDEISDLAFSWFLYPVIKIVDKHPVYDDAEVAAMKAKHADIREARRAGRATEEGTDVERAQRRYIGDRATYAEKWQS
jgi:hypothetical protein